ncbi:DUF7379 domain-containing protein [Larkinella terrae]|uniref:Uncharacterized protein n=1 Tax=Larkinella terrae TaxID=2025311 RepID=A0A7K0EVH7_9BACT|nr:caspase family protein [Larkinella terrae]MRS65438.1 hypothetical protein [Larkinella terrae]
MESTIYALLVGINDYAKKPLKGCLNDLAAVETFLRWFQPDANKLRIRKLVNEQATRAEVIDGFAHFDQASGTDICLFYFFGHGSFATAPAGFYSPTNRFHQSLVCWDSRNPGGRDLMDKELAYLIWKYSVARQKTALRIVVITDSCHSGTVTRNATENRTEELRERSLDPFPGTLTAEDYYGFSEEVNGQRGYVTSSESGKELITVQTAPHIHLAAARDNQTAKENVLNGQARGLFTYSLLKALQESKGLISYAELIRRTELQLKSYVTDQNPLLNIESLPSDAARNRFLQSETSTTKPTNWVAFTGQRGWCIDAGAVLGARSGDVVMLENGVSTRIGEVFPEESTVLAGPGLDQLKQYQATWVPKQLISFGIDPTVPAPVRAFLKAASQTGFSLKLTDGIDDQTRFRIRAEGSLVYVTGLADTTPLFKERAIQTDDDAVLFLEELQYFSTWTQLLNLQNPTSTLTDSDFQLSVTVAVSPPDPDYKPDTFREVADLTQPVPLFYFGDESPALQIQIENRSNRALWFQPFYLGFDYSISNRSLNAFSLAPNSETTVTFNVRNTSTGLISASDILRLKVDKTYRDLGYSEILEHVKVIVSTQELETGILNKYNQKGLDLAKKRTETRGELERSPDDGMDDEVDDGIQNWITTTVSLQINYPAKGVLIPAGGFWDSTFLRIQTPASFQTSFAWSSPGEIKRSIGEVVPPDLVMGNAALQPFNWLQTRGDSASLNTLELYDYSDRNAVSPEQPLLIEFKASVGDSFVVLAYDPSTGLYFSAGDQIGDQTVAVHTLPDESSSQRSLGGSIKLFFYKVVLSKVGFGYNHPRLALATLSDTLEVQYETDPEMIRHTLQQENVKNILLFTHGIIGDTLDMTKSARLALTADGQPIEKKIDAILTFDYENLSTRIQDNAQKLKERLAEVGIKAQDGKQVTIIAHSMGGLVTRWFIEKLRGDEVVDRVILCGTPNEGTPLADVRDAFEVLLTFAVNGASILKPWLFGINLLGKLGSEVSVSFKQMDMVTGIYGELNDQTDPRIPYYIIAGDIRQIELDLSQEMSLIKKMFQRLGRAAKYDLLDQFVFRASNDIAVGTKSILSIPGSESWSKPPVTFTVACDHVNYFVNPLSLKVLGSLF